MNDQQLTEVMEGLNEATAFAPGGSKQLVPATTARDAMTVNSVKLGADLVSIYQGLVDLCNKKLENAKKVAALWADEAAKLAEEAAEMDKQINSIGKGVMKVLDEHGVKFDGEL